ncbi:YbfB/YjiJ family MFS transporter, partial [Klebsiella pneumoniae]
MNNQSRQALWLALAGSIVLMIGMGYGRFAFTGVLPLMLNEGLLTLHEGNLAASANYAGYLVGALLLARVQPGAATIPSPPRQAMKICWCCTIRSRRHGRH